ncbi:MAG: class I SAM-dependent methyltransferase [Deltaproteobacteria bacterium]|nr:class I SAM-dependent methyltransferase [Deltaproteobacteria bacterium]
MSDPTRSHWERVYESKLPSEVSWYQPVPERSLELIRATGEPLDAPILDVGGGASTLVDHLIAAGHSDVSVLDIAANALEHARERLRDAAARVTWIEADVTRFEPKRAYAIWHDRAVFHFLTDAADRARYLAVLRASLRPRGHFVLATFGPEGPTRCSGLPVQRYSLDEIVALLGPGFALRAHFLEDHRTPSGALQQFLYARWQVE